MNTYSTEKVVTSSSEYLEKIFNEGRLIIPAYQRPYSWDVENANDLWNDLFLCYQAQNDQHFIGPMYFKVDITNLSELEVTDGQQRITTIMLFLTALKKVAYEEFLELRREKVEDFILEIDRFLFSNEKLRLTLGSSDKNAYEKVVLNFKEITNNLADFEDMFDSSQVFLSSAKQLHANFNSLTEKLYFFINYVKNIHGFTFDDYKMENDTKLVNQFIDVILIEFNKLLYTLMRRFVFVKCIIVSSDSSKTFKLFETINDRGKHLDQVDKIKNYLFKNIHNFAKTTQIRDDDLKYDRAKKLWSEIQAVLDNDLEDYIRYYIIQSNYIGSYVAPKNLFTSIETNFENGYEISDFDQDVEALKKLKLKDLRDKSYKFIEDLHNNKSYYSAILEPAKDVNSKERNDKTRSLLKYSYNYKIIRALILKLLITFRKDHVKLNSLLIVTTNLAILYVSIFGFRRLDSVEKQIYDKFFKENDAFTDTDIFALRLKNAMKAVMSNFEWDNDILKDKLSRLTNDQVAYYLQCRLNDYIQVNDKSGDYYFRIVLKSNSEDSLNKDHILPVNYDADYKFKIQDYFIENGYEVPTKKQLYNEYLSRIGNIIPVKKSANINKSNGGNPIKFYEEELSVKGVLVQKLVEDYDEWCIKEILDRSSKIAKLIIDYGVLSIDPEKVKF